MRKNVVEAWCHVWPLKSLRNTKTSDMSTSPWDASCRGAISTEVSTGWSESKTLHQVGLGRTTSRVVKARYSFQTVLSLTTTRMSLSFRLERQSKYVASWVRMLHHETDLQRTPTARSPQKKKRKPRNIFSRQDYKVDPTDWKRSLLNSDRRTVLVIRVLGKDAATTATETKLADDIFGANGDNFNLKKGVRSMLLRSAPVAALDYEPHDWD